jgi:hypothetical protein
MMPTLGREISVSSLLGFASEFVRAGRQEGWGNAVARIALVVPNRIMAPEDRPAGCAGRGVAADQAAGVGDEPAGHREQPVPQGRDPHPAGGVGLAVQAGRGLRHYVGAPARRPAYIQTVSPWLAGMLVRMKLTAQTSSASSAPPRVNASWSGATVRVRRDRGSALSRSVGTWCRRTT